MLGCTNEGCCDADKPLPSSSRQPATLASAFTISFRAPDLLDAFLEGPSRMYDKQCCHVQGHVGTFPSGQTYGPSL